jgi:thiamine kinase-like enzyme
MREQIVHILSMTGASQVVAQEQIQELWSGYGCIYRLQLEGGNWPSVIVKWIDPPAASNHPRGWNTSVGNQRKLKSYEIEAHWYEHYNEHISASLWYPKLIGQTKEGANRLFVLEDLASSGFVPTYQGLTLAQIHEVLRWLARFHAQFMQVEPEGLWQTGTYWHLATRQEEWEQMDNLSLKRAAQSLDERLNNCQYKTIVHGDAKQANFAFNPDGSVAAFDFQYVGGGCGIKDVIYFLSSCLSGSELMKLEADLLNVYFKQLKESTAPMDTTAIEAEWRELYAVAWADFARFLNGWSPGHYKLNKYVADQVDQALSV